LAKDDWVAAVTEPAAEYSAKIELERLGLHPYLAQFRKVWSPPGASKPMVRLHPLFPRYLFLPLIEARVREMHYARGLRRPQAILASAEGRPWVATESEINTVIQLEKQGSFDEILAIGDRVRLKKTGVLSGIEILLSSSTSRTAELFLPLFGGCRGTSTMESIVRA
jgi:hypothetical protein